MIAVFSVKKIAKKFMILSLISFILIMMVKTISFAIKKNDINTGKIIKLGLPSIKKIEKNLDIETSLLEYQLLTIEDYDEDFIVPEIIEKTEYDNIKIEENIIVADKNVTTEVIKTNIKENPNTNINGVKIKNETSFAIHEGILDNTIKFDNKNILIFHTHTCESYTQTEQMKYVSSGNYRTTDLNYSVSRVGDELEKYLKNYGFNVIHNKEYHDYPAYSGSYTRSLKTVTNIIKQNNPFNLVFDLHRDAIGSNSNYAPKVKIGEDYCAQIMFVIGTNQGGLEHPNWIRNLSYAIKIQEKAEEMYPGLFKTMIVRNSRYNQHLNDGASIIEIGATGNTLEECLNSMKYLSSVLNELF